MSLDQFKQFLQREVAESQKLAKELGLNNL